MNHSPINVGIDTSKDQLDIAIIPSNHFFSVSNDGNGIASAIEKLLLIHPDRVLIEATDRLELPFAIAAYKAGLQILSAMRVTFITSLKARENSLKLTNLMHSLLLSTAQLTSQN